MDYAQVPFEFLSEDSPLALPTPTPPKKAVPAAPKSTLQEMINHARRHLDEFRPFAACEAERNALRAKLRAAERAIEKEQPGPRPEVKPPRDPWTSKVQNDAALDIRKTVNDGFRDGLLTVADLEPCRRFVAWRVVRELGYIFGALLPDQRLQDAVGPPGVPASDAFTDHNRLPIRGWPARATFAIREIQKAPDQGLPLLPPKRPEVLLPYVRTVSAIVDHLRITQGAPRQPNLGRYGIVGLLDVDTILVAFPTLNELVELEDELISETKEVMANWDARRANNHLYATYGLRSEEIAGLIQLAKSSAKKETLNADIEEERALMILKLERTARRARKAFNMREEVNILKQIAQLRGFTRQDPENIDDEFFKVAKEVSARREQPLRTIDAAPARQLPLEDEDGDGGPDPV